MTYVYVYICRMFVLTTYVEIINRIFLPSVIDIGDKWYLPPSIYTGRKISCLICECEFISAWYELVIFLLDILQLSRYMSSNSSKIQTHHRHRWCVYKDIILSPCHRINVLLKLSIKDVRYWVRIISRTIMMLFTITILTI